MRKVKLTPACGNTPFLETALRFFKQLRESSLQKKTATAELLNWLLALKTIFPDEENPQAHGKQVLERTLSVLIKNKEDNEIAQQLILRSF